MRSSAILYFIDETCHTNERFLGVGGIAISSARIIEIEDNILSMRERFGKSGEVKWSAMRGRRDSIEVAYANYLRELVVEGKAHFHVSFAELASYNHDLSGERKKIETVSKRYFQHLLHRPVRFYGGSRILHIIADDGECTQRLPEFTAALNRSAKAEFELDRPVLSIRQEASASIHALQLLDVTLGAFGALRNGRFGERDDGFKAHVARTIWELWGTPNLADNSSWKDKRMNVWNMVPSFET